MSCISIGLPLIFLKASLDYNPLQMFRFPSPSSSTFTVPPFLLDHCIDLDKQMSGKGFIEPHRNNLPRRKRKVVTVAEHGAIALEIDKTVSQILLPASEAGPRSSIRDSILQEGPSPTSTDNATLGFTAICSPATQTQIYASSSGDTNITEPPSSLGVSTTPSTPLHKSPTSSNSSAIFPIQPTLQTPKSSFFHGYHHLHDTLLRSPPPITPSKGHLQPTSATLPRRHRLSVAREERRRKSLVEQQRKSICAQELSKGIILGFLADGDERDENIVRIKVCNDPTTPLFSPLSPSTTLSTLSSELHLQLTLPTDSSSYIDGTTSLTDSQIQQACTFIDEHISIPLADPTSINSTQRPGHVSVLILTPCFRPEEAMSIGISYLAGLEDMERGGAQEVKEEKAK